MHSPRQLAFLILRDIQKGAYADVALNRALQSWPSEQVTASEASLRDRRLVTELVYGVVRRQRTLDALIDQLAKKPAVRQPPDLRLVLRLGLYQLRYLSHIPPSAAVDTTVNLAKQNGLKGLTGVVNGLLRQYLRRATSGDPLQLPEAAIARLGIQHSYPDWIIQLWLEQFGEAEAEALACWMNQPPVIDLRINPLQTDLAQVTAAMGAVGISLTPVPPLPQALRFTDHAGAIQHLPGFSEGWWTVQDSSAQLVSHFLNPQPGEIVIDACAAPGGKTTHIAELMGDCGTVWACDRYASRLKKVKANAERLRLTCIYLWEGDSRILTRFTGQADRVLVDAPCSGLGTLHRHADARWRQTPDTVAELALLQRELLDQAATWVKPAGILIYATCTLHPAENEAIARSFLRQHPDWRVIPPTLEEPAYPFVTPEGWVKVLPHRHQMDGFFMVRFCRPG
jgi:16S rRNA (cytosine967-C5)-methyltransferase